MTHGELQEWRRRLPERGSCDELPLTYRLMAIAVATEIYVALTKHGLA